MTPSPAMGHSSDATSPPRATRVPTPIRESSLYNFTSSSSRVARTSFVRLPCTHCASWPCSSATAVRRRPEPRTNILDRGASSHTKRNTFGRSLCRVISLEYVVAQRALRTLSQLRLCRIPEPARRGGCLLRHVRDSLQSLSTPLMARSGTGGALKGRA